MLVTEVTTATSDRGYTRADLDALPDDGQRHELIDGTIVMTPAPGFAHQTVSLRLAVLLNAHLPAGLAVVCAPFDVALSADTVVEPDLIVAPTADFTDRDLPVPPLLAVEIASPSTRLVDRRTKFTRYEEAGIAAYWIVDPHAPSLTAWHLVDGRYRQVGHVTGEETFVATQPVAVLVTPAHLVRPGR